MAVHVNAKRSTAKYEPLYTRLGMKPAIKTQDPSDRIANAERIRSGLPYQLVVDLQEMLGVSVRELARITGLNDRTLSRRRGGVLNPEESERLSAVARVVDQAMFAFNNNAEGMRRWFKQPNAMLLHRRPIDLLFSHESLGEVSVLLERFVDGDVS
jgi:putative toxin-antitoxin system antitoxin component (TIGR02293 family)